MFAFCPAALRGGESSDGEIFTDGGRRLLRPAALPSSPTDREDEFGCSIIELPAFEELAYRLRVFSDLLATFSFLICPVARGGLQVCPLAKS